MKNLLTRLVNFLILVMLFSPSLTLASSRVNKPSQRGGTQNKSMPFPSSSGASSIKSTSKEIDFRSHYFTIFRGGPSKSPSIKYVPDHRKITAAYGSQGHGIGIKIGFFEESVHYDHANFTRKPRFGSPKFNSFDNSSVQNSGSIFYKKATHNETKNTVHGTAVASLIGGQTTEALGAAPGAQLQHICWHDGLKTADKELHILNASCTFPSKMLWDSVDKQVFFFDKFMHTEEFETLAHNNTLVCLSYGNDRDRKGSQDYHNYHNCARALEKLAVSEKIQDKMLVIGSLTLNPETGGEKISKFSQRKEVSGGNTNNIPIIFAPGDNVLCADAKGTIQPFSGTSMAAPITSGNLAILIGKFKEWRNLPEIYIDLLLAGARNEKLLTQDARQQFFSERVGFGCVDVMMSINLAFLIGDSAQIPPAYSSDGIMRSLNHQFMNLSEYRASFYLKAPEEQKKIFVKMYGSHLKEGAEFLESGKEPLFPKWTDEETSYKEGGTSLSKTWAKEKTIVGLDRFIKRLDYKLAKKTLATDQERKQTLLILRERAIKAQGALYTAPWEREQTLYQYFKMGGGRLFDPKAFKSPDKEVFIAVRMRQKLNNALYMATPKSNPGILHFIHDTVEFGDNKEEDDDEIKGFDQAVNQAISSSKKVDDLYFQLKKENPGYTHQRLVTLVSTRLFQKEGKNYLTLTKAHWEALRKAEQVWLENPYNATELSHFIQDISEMSESADLYQRQSLYQQQLFKKHLTAHKKGWGWLPSSSLGKIFKQTAEIKFSGHVKAYNIRVCNQMINTLKDDLLPLTTLNPLYVSELGAFVLPILQKAQPKEAKEIAVQTLQKISNTILERLQKDGLNTSLPFIGAAAHLYRISPSEPNLTTSFKQTALGIIKCLSKNIGDNGKVYENSKGEIQEFIRYVKGSGVDISQELHFMAEDKSAPQIFYQSFKKSWDTRDSYDFSLMK